MSRKKNNEKYPPWAFVCCDLKINTGLGFWTKVGIGVHSLIHTTGSANRASIIVSRQNTGDANYKDMELQWQILLLRQDR